MFKHVAFNFPLFDSPLHIFTKADISALILGCATRHKTLQVIIILWPAVSHPPNKLPIVTTFNILILYVYSFRNSQEPLDMTTTAGSRATPKERASVIMASPATGHRTPSAAATGGISDPVIDEHFRRSLGKDYMNVFAPVVAQRQEQQAPATAAAAPSIDGDDDDDAGLSGIYLKFIIPISCLLCTVLLPVVPIEFTFRHMTNKILANQNPSPLLNYKLLCLLRQYWKSKTYNIYIDKFVVLNSNWLYTFRFQKKIYIYLQFENTL